MSNYKKKTRWKYVVGGINFLQIILFLLFGVRIYQMDILPSKYMIGYVGVVIFIGVLFGILTVKAVEGMKSAIVIMSISFIFCIALLWSNNVLKEVQNTLEEVTIDEDIQKEVVTEVTILVLKDSQVTDITEMKEFIIGSMGDELKEVSQMKEEINTALNDSPQYVSFDDMYVLVDALYAKTANAIIMDKAFIDVISETEGYETFQDDIKEVYSTEMITYVNIVEKQKDLNNFVVYVSGIDRFGHISATSRSDVNLLLVVNTQTKQIQMINTPRDYYVVLPNSNGMKDKLTHAGLYGVDCSMQTLEKLYGVEIDYYVKMNFSGFEAIIDALGGIDVYSEYDFTVEPIKHYKVGMNHLMGLEALAFARERKVFGAGDIQRGKNQMEVVRATINKILSKEILYSYTKVLESVSDTLQTNMTSEELYELVKMQISDMSSWEINSYTVTGTGSKAVTFSTPNKQLYVMIPNQSMVKEAKSLINNVLEGKVE